MTPASAIGARPEDKAWHIQSAEEVLAQLASTAEGLSAQKAARRPPLRAARRQHSV